MENKFQRQQRITATKNLAEGLQVQDQAVNIYGQKFDVVRWRIIHRGRNLCGLRAYSRACWKCASTEGFIEEE